MQEKTISASEFRKTFGETLDMVLGGKLVIVTNHSKPWVKFAPPRLNTDEKINAFDLRLNVKELFGKVYYSKKSYAVIRKGETVAVMVTCAE